jgi:hypothetical protein
MSKPKAKANASSTPQMYNQDEISRLAQDPKNMVYQYVHDNPTATFTVQQQKTILSRLRPLYLQLRTTYPDWSDEKLRDQIKNTDAELQSFADNNERTFQLFTKHDATDDQLNHIRYMLYLREMQAIGCISDIQAQETIQNYLIQAHKTNMSLEEYKAQVKKEKAEKQQKQKAQKKGK